LNNSLSKPWV